MRTLLVALTIVATAQSQTKPSRPAPKPAPVAAKPASPAQTQPQTEASVNAFMQRMFGYDPAIKWKVADISPTDIAGVTRVVVLIGEQQQRPTTLYVMPSGEFAITGELLPYGADPFAKTRERLGKEAKGRSKGSATPTVTLVEFSDLQCPYCKLTQPVIDKLVEDVPGVKLIFQHYPLTHIHPWAESAAKHSECVADQDAASFWKYIQSVYDAQANLKPETADAQLTELATKAGVDATKLAACLKSPATAARIEKSLELGGAVEVTSTPTLFINGRKVVGVRDIPYDKLKAMVEFEAREAQKTTK